mgnify:CR=1 FL=1
MRQLPEPLHYSSSGVREQTAELSSSFLGDSDTQRPSQQPNRFSQDSANRRSFDSASSPRQSLELAHQRKSVDSERSLGDDERLQKGQTRPEVIQEQSEPVSPEVSSSNLPEMLWQDGDRQSGQLRPRPRPYSDVPSLVISEAGEEDATEETPLFGRRASRRASAYKTLDGAQDDEDDEDVEGQRLPRVKSWQTLQHAYPSLRKVAVDGYHVATHPKEWDMQQVFKTVVVKPALVMPSVFLGVLLNLLDALSYGIILFPLGEEVFSSMGADGVSMFYVSCITAQLTYSSGSIFSGGVGSEMIEVVPFFHKMTYMIMSRMGTGNPDALRATVITSYAMSSILTGLVFLGLGAAKLGTLVNFFPHSILTGCIGGVGIFLFVTGIEGWKSRVHRSCSPQALPSRHHRALAASSLLGHSVADSQALLRPTMACPCILHCYHRYLLHCCRCSPQPWNGNSAPQRMGLRCSTGRSAILQLLQSL